MIPSPGFTFIESTPTKATMPKQVPKPTFTFVHPVYSPKGGIEGALVSLDGKRAQLSVKHAPHLEEALSRMHEGDEFAATVEPRPASDKGDAAHPVYELLELSGRDDSVSSDGRSQGTVVRLNYALHGEPNGVVLDNGDFIHLRPDGQRQFRLAPGDRVEASGDARSLRFGGGRVIEATILNGQPLSKPAKDGKPGGHKPPPKRVASMAHGVR